MSRPALSAIGLFCFAATIAAAGMPWRPPIEQLAKEAELIVIGKVRGIQPSLITDSEGRRFAIAEISISETLKGKSRDLLRVAVETPPRYDENGTALALGSAWRYELEVGEHEYLLFLSHPSAPNATHFIPAHHGSGIIDLRPNRPNSQNNAVEHLRELLRKARGK